MVYTIIYTRTLNNYTVMCVCVIYGFILAEQKATVIGQKYIKV